MEKEILMVSRCRTCSTNISRCSNNLGSSKLTFHHPKCQALKCPSANLAGYEVYHCEITLAFGSTAPVAGTEENSCSSVLVRCKCYYVKEQPCWSASIAPIWIVKEKHASLSSSFLRRNLDWNNRQGHPNKRNNTTVEDPTMNFEISY